MNWDDDVSKRLPSTVSTPHDMCKLSFSLWTLTLLLLNPLQCSCLENPRDSGAWWATVHGVTKSLKGLNVHIYSR